MRVSRVAAASFVLALACAGAAGAARAAAPQELTIAASDGTQLACALVEPDGTPGADGWPALILFHGLGGSHEDMEPIATGSFAPAGFASLMCDARGQGASGGEFGLDGPRDVQDARELFAWLAARPEVSDTRIGAFGISLGGGAVWEAAVAGVPFRAIVPALAWTNLASALAPQGLPRSGLVQYLAGLVPVERWEPDLLAAQAALTTGADPATVNALAAARSPLPRLGSLTVPTLLIQGRHDFLFDLDQALAAYRKLRGPKALYVGDLGHLPASNPPAEQPTYLGEATAWFDRFVKGDAAAPAVPAVALAHDPWDGTVTRYAALPKTRRTSVALPGRSTIQSGGSVVRSARFTGGPFETFGGATVKVPYSDAHGWDRLVAVLTVAGNPVPVAVGGVRLTKASGTATIRLPNEVVRIPRGAKLTVALGATSTVQSPANALYVADVRPGSTIAIGRETLTLSVLKQAPRVGP